MKRAAEGAMELRSQMELGNEGKEGKFLKKEVRWDGIDESVCYCAVDVFEKRG